ncbi:MAG: hypothetical protein ACFCGT_17690 [Sandaracinaceae bacterium]
MRSIHGLVCFPLALSALGLAPVPARAQTLVDGGPAFVEDPNGDIPPVAENMETARTLAMGLGARASATSTSAVAVNPAGMGIGRHYHIESAGLYEPQDSRFAVGGTVVDSSSGPVQAGVHFRYIHGNGKYGHAGFDTRASLAMPLGDAFAVGLTGRYVSFWQQGQENRSPPHAQGFTFDAAIRVTPTQGLHIAALGNNLLEIANCPAGSATVCYGRGLLPRTVGGSVSYTFEDSLTLAFDGLADLSTNRSIDGKLVPEGLFGGAVEYFTGEIPIRVGYYFDTLRSLHVFSGGLGFVTEQFAVEASVRQQINRDAATTLLASFRYFVQ